MENLYTAYIKSINNVDYYFIKKFSCFPELNNVPPILQSFGMHTDFGIACKIADVYDVTVKQKLYTEIHQDTCFYNKSKPALSNSLRVELVNNKPSIVTKLSGLKKIISDRMPHWRILSHS